MKYRIIYAQRLCRAGLDDGRKSANLPPSRLTNFFSSLLKRDSPFHFLSDLEPKEFFGAVF